MDVNVVAAGPGEPRGGLRCLARIVDRREHGPKRLLRHAGFYTI